MEKIKRKNKSDYGENFVPPDGGWGWTVCFASGFTNICMFPIFQQFGLIFRDKLLAIGLTNREITSIINSHFAISSLSGFFNGFIFRKFSYRGVALVASVILTSGIYFMTYVETFLFFMLIYALYLGIAKGYIISSKQVAFLTYFKKNRRKALSIIVTLPAIGQIIMPYLVTFLMYQYGIKGTLLIFCGIAMHSFAAALIYQPAHWHSKSNKPFEYYTDATFCIFCGLRNENDLKQLSLKISKDDLYFYDPEEKFCNCTKINTLVLSEELKTIDNDLKIIDDKETTTKLGKESFRYRIVSFLDLDLLKDKSFMNICFGMICTMFVEQNFTTLAPFFLSDFGYSYGQITFAMSFSRIPDLLSRIITPYVVQDIHWQNRSFWLICVMGTTFSEMIIARNPSFGWIVFFMFFSGIFRGSKMIFHGMLIPDYVPLKRMPAALGLNRMLGGIFMLSIGPIIGLIRDKSNFQMALMFLNLISMIPITLWSIELYCKKPSSDSQSESNNEKPNNINISNEEKSPMITENK